MYGNYPKMTQQSLLEDLLDLHEQLLWFYRWNSAADHGHKCPVKGYTFSEPFCLKCETEKRLSQLLQISHRLLNLEAQEIYKVKEALQDSVGLIEHLGGNPKLQRRALEALNKAIEANDTEELGEAVERNSKA